MYFTLCNTWGKRREGTRKAMVVERLQLEKRRKLSGIVSSE
jgi:hypothetical protein